MKLKILAAAVAASFAFPMAAQAELKIGGDVGVFYDTSMNNGDGGFQELGSEVNFDGSTEIDGVTYYGHMELDVNGTGNDVRMDEVRVGAKGGFGEIILGETDNACDAFDPGSNDIWLGGHSSSCHGDDTNNIIYKNSMGGASFAVSYNPEAEITAVGGKFGMGGFSVNLGYEDGTGVGTDDSRVSYGVAGSFANVNVSAEGNDQDQWGVNADTSFGGHTVWVSYGEINAAGDDSFGVGWRTSHGNMDYIIEHTDNGTDDQTIAGIRYRF